MDFFGIGQALIGACEVYFRGARYTGRTTNLVDSLENEDRVIFSNRNEAERVRGLAKDRGINIDVLVCNPVNFNPFEAGLGTSQKRTIFDHTFVEDFHRNSLERSIKDLDYFEEQLSGYGRKHRETKRKAIELAKWNISK